MYLCAFRCLISRTQNLILRSQNHKPLPLSTWKVWCLKQWLDALEVKSSTVAVENLPVMLQYCCFLRWVLPTLYIGSSSVGHQSTGYTYNQQTTPHQNKLYHKTNNINIIIIVAFCIHVAGISVTHWPSRRVLTYSTCISPQDMRDYIWIMRPIAL